MARYLTITPQYDPFSLQELMVIPAMYNEAYDKAQTTYDDLQDKTSILRAYAKNSPEAAARLEAYDRDMEDVASAMASGRWTSNIANKASKLRQNYRDYIIPIQTGVSAYETYSQNRMKRDDGTLIGPSYTVNDFILNPSLTDNSLVGSSVQQEAMKAAAVEASGRVVRPNWQLESNGQYFGAETGNGYTAAERAAYLSNPNHPTFDNLNVIKNQLREKYDYYNRTPEEQHQIDMYINRGIYDGMVGNVEYKQIANMNARVRGGGGGDGSKPKEPKAPTLKFAGVVEANVPTIDKKGKKTNNVNKTDAELPEDAQLISLEEAMNTYRDQFYSMFSNNAKDGYELASMAPYYNFYVLDKNAYELSSGPQGVVSKALLYAIPKSKDSSHAYERNEQALQDYYDATFTPYPARQTVAKLQEAAVQNQF